MMKIYDCFPFFNELQLLKIRLEYLYDYVDYFVICESTHTHSGKPKPLYYDSNREEFARWGAKIVHLVYTPKESDLLSFQFPVEPKSPEPAWVLEQKQRDHLLAGISNCEDGDCIVVTDVDEIWSRELTPLLRSAESGLNLARIGMQFFYYYVNCIGVGEVNREWRHAYFFRWKKQVSDLSLSKLRTNGKMNLVKNVGWHFSFLGGPAGIRDKLEAFAHQEFNQEKYRDLQYVESCLDRGVDHLERPGVDWAFIPMSRFPKDLADILSRYPGLIRSDLLGRSKA